MILNIIAIVLLTEYWPTERNGDNSKSNDKNNSWRVVEEEEEDAADEEGNGEGQDAVTEDADRLEEGSESKVKLTDIRHSEHFPLRCFRLTTDD